MKLRQIFYLIREGLRNTWQNRLMALASVGVLICCLMLTGFAYLIYVNVEQMFHHAIEQNVVAVFLDKDLTDAQVEKVGITLNSMSNVDKVKLITKEEYLAKYAENLTEGIVESYQGEKNPMPNTYIVSMKDLELFQDTLDEIQKIRGVEEASYDAGVAETLSQIRGVVLAIGGGIIGVLLVVSLFIIVNTIKLTVYNRRLEIYIMKSVGATDGFVRFPFVVEGLTLGIIGAALAFFIEWGLYNTLVKWIAGMNNFNLLELVPFDELLVPMMATFGAAGIFVGLFGSFTSIRKFLDV